MPFSPALSGLGNKSHDPSSVIAAGYNSHCPSTNTVGTREKQRSPLCQTEVMKLTQELHGGGGGAGTPAQAWFPARCSDSAGLKVYRLFSFLQKLNRNLHVPTVRLYVTHV